MNQKEIDKIMNELADGDVDAEGICLFFYVNHDFNSLKDLYELGIKGEELNTFIEFGCPSDVLEYIHQTIDFLKSGNLSNEEIFNNLRKKKPIPFTPHVLIKSQEDKEKVYKDFADEFRKKSLNKKR